MFKSLFLYILSFILIILFGIICLSVGRYPISILEISIVLFKGLFGGIFNVCLPYSNEYSNLFLKTLCSPIVHSLSPYISQNNELISNIIFEVRLPRIILSCFIGASLSACGVAFQSLFRNPLATPDILGVTSGASFGAVLALLLGINIWGVAFFGIFFGIFSLFLVILVGFDKNNPHNTITMILSGIIISALFQSLISIVKYIADPQDVLPTITYWLLGSLDSSFSIYFFVGIFSLSVGTLCLFCLRWKLNLLALEDDEAKTLGINLSLIRIFVILCVTIITACSVSLCGIIGWIGLLIPHVARLIVGSENSRLLPLSLLMGAIFLMLCDTLARSISANQIPISILTALIGAPFFIYILRKYKTS